MYDSQEKQKAARARKQRMLEMEVEAKKKAFKSDIEVGCYSQEESWGFDDYR